MTAGKILSHKGSDVVTIRPEDTLEAAVRVLRDKRIGAAVVLGDDGQPAGVFSSGTSSAWWPTMALRPCPCRYRPP